MLLICGLLIERLRAGNYRSLPLLIAVIVAVVGAAAGESLGAAGVPGAARDRRCRRSRMGSSRRVLIALVLVVVLALGVFALLSAVSAVWRPL